DLDRCADCSPDAGCDASVGKAQSSLVDAGSFPECQGGPPGVFDMIGNAWEWEDSCDDAGIAPPPDGSPDDAGTPSTAYDHCWRRGGSYIYPHANRPRSCLSCEGCADDGGSFDGFYRSMRGAKPGDVGFRCCRELGP